ncbi:YczE/YyaS/YitT family protein [Anoxynatronum sibiricum]|uniref:DUF6198 family protein n=1 Tax=Anoxynatronum sibiricum TaxID=210623 RepID=A0ABU9VX57_9CLOT
MAVQEKTPPLAAEMAVPVATPGVHLWVRRISIYVLGMFLLALGVSFSIKSSLGVSPMNSLPYVISRIINVDMGIITTLIFSSYVVIQILLLRRNFRLKNLFQVLVASMFGTFVSFTNRLLVFPAPESYLVQLALLGVSLILIGLGILFYLVGDLVPQPPEGLVMTIATKINRPFSSVKVIFDCVIVSAALMLSFLSGNGMMGVREGTLIAALGIGRVIGLFSRWFRPALMTFCHGKNGTAQNIK